MNAGRVMRGAALAVLVVNAYSAQAQQLDARFSCSQTRVVDNQSALYADSGVFRFDGKHIEEFHWESSLFRSTHGFECSIAETDGLQSDVRGDAGNASWRVSLLDARAARNRRGYDSDHGINCAIRLEREGDMLHVRPTCPALCGSRSNFSALSVDLKTGSCRYEE